MIAIFVISAVFALAYFSATLFLDYLVSETATHTPERVTYRPYHVWSGCTCRACQETLEFRRAVQDGR